MSAPAIQRKALVLWCWECDVASEDERCWICWKPVDKPYSRPSKLKSVAGEPVPTKYSDGKGH